MTIHKSKSLEFERVIVLGVEEQAYWAKPDEERSAFFVGISRAKACVVLTTCQVRERPHGYTKTWHTQRSAHQEFISYGLGAK